MKKWTTGILISLLLIIAIFFIFIFLDLGKYTREILKISGSITKIGNAITLETKRAKGAELLLDNTNKILSTIYFGTSDSGGKTEFKNFTAFSMVYKDQYFLVTAGHCIEYQGEKYSNFKFKANNRNDWIKPELVMFKNDYQNNIDYAIFRDKRFITMGLIPAGKEEDLKPQYILGNTERDLNLIKKYSEAREGESGSPILNSNCHVIGIIITENGGYTPISEVISALGQLQD